MSATILGTIHDPVTLQTMIEILGSWCSPRQPHDWPRVVGLEDSTAEIIEYLIRRLGTDPSDEARQALTELAENPQLEDWHRYLINTREAQNAIHRDAHYTHPGIRQIQAALNGGPPANAADLRALLLDWLNDVSGDLRGGSSDPWRQFWNENPDRSLAGPKSENSCRDALVANLRPRLVHHNVDVVREGSHAGDTRDDIRGRLQRTIHNTDGNQERLPPRPVESAALPAQG